MLNANPGTAVSNSAFLAELASAAPSGTALWVTSFVGSPELTDVRNWHGKLYRPALMAGHVDGWGEQNTYFAVAALKPTADGEINRRKANFGRLLALVVDDIQLEDVQGQVSWVLETSPGKTQVGILIDGGDSAAADIGLVDRLVTTMAERGLMSADRSGNNAVRWVRLPVGSNLKPRQSGPWAHVMQRWSPEVRLSLEDAAGAFGIDLDEIRTEVRATPAPATGLVIGSQDERLRVLTASVIRGDNLHDSLNQIAASLVATGMPGGAVVNMLRGLMESSHAAKDERWLSRYQDIPRSVSTAEEKFAKPAIALHAQEAETLPVLSPSQLEQAASSITWAIKHVLPADSVGMMFGASGTFKSFVALDMALHMAHGLPWLGKKTKQGTVLFIAAEGGAGLWRRVKAWHQARGLSWVNAPFYVLPVAVMLGDRTADVVAAAQAVGVKPDLLIVDTMSQTFDGEENSANEVAGYLRTLSTAFRALWECVVLVIHHSGHSATERPRGSSAIVSNTDFLFGVFRDEKEMLTTVTCEKQKDGDRFEPQTFTLASQLLGRDEDGEDIRSLVASHVNNATSLLAAVQHENAAGRGGMNDLLLRLAQNGMPHDSLRRAFYAELGDKKTEAKQKAYVRALGTAKQRGLIEIAEGRVIVLVAVDNSSEE